MTAARRLRSALVLVLFALFALPSTSASATRRKAALGAGIVRVPADAHSGVSRMTEVRGVLAMNRARPPGAHGFVKTPHEWLQVAALYLGQKHPWQRSSDNWEQALR